MDEKTIEKYIIESSGFMGRISEHVKNIDERQERLEQNMATKEDMKRVEARVVEHNNYINDPNKECPAAKRVLHKHKDLEHPSKEEKMGRKVIGAVQWFKEHPIKGIFIPIVAFVSTYLGLDFFDVIGGMF